MSSEETILEESPVQATFRFAKENPRTYADRPVRPPVKPPVRPPVRLVVPPSPPYVSSSDSSGSSDISDFTDIDDLQEQCELLRKSKRGVPRKMTAEDMRSPYPPIHSFVPPTDFQPVDSFEAYMAMSPEEQMARCEPLFLAYFKHPEPRLGIVKQLVVNHFLIKRPEQPPDEDSDFEDY